MPANSAATTERPALPRDVHKFLTELAVALNNHGIYPGDHPQLQAASESVRVRLRTLLAERPLIAIGVAHRQLVIDGCATDPANPVLRGLAQRLHRRRIGGITLEPGITGREFAELLRAVADEDLALFGEGTAPAWEHAEIHPIDYSRLRLTDDATETEVRGTTPASRLWLRLASTALDSPADPSLAETEPAELARAVEAGGAEHDEVIARCLLQLASELKHHSGEEDREVSERISSLVVSLAPDTLERLVTLAGSAATRRQLVLDASHAFAADAVVEIVRAAAATDEQTISHSLLRLFGKMASHSGSSNRRLSSNAADSLRTQVASLVEGWTLDDPNPEAYTGLLDTMSREHPHHDAHDLDENAAPEPLRMVQMCLELEDAGPRLAAALQPLEAQGELDALLPLLEPQPETNAAAERIWDRLATPENLVVLIGRGASTAWALERLLSRLGDEAVRPLLEILITSESRSIRRTTFACLVRLGSVAVPAVLARLEAVAPWYVQRNLLLLLHEIAVDPSGPIWRMFLEHEDARVRREAVKLLLSSQEWRTRALCTALADDDPQMQLIGLMDAQRGCPPLAISLLLGYVRNPACSAEQRVLAIRGLRSTHRPEVLEALLQLGGPQRGWFGRDRLAKKSPEMLAALDVLVSDWREEPRVSQLLQMIPRSGDPDLHALLDDSRN